jgi:ankyrin repeat protein
MGAHFSTASAEPGNSLLLISAHAGNASAVQAILAAGLEPVNRIGPRGSTALMLAAEKGHAEVTAVLLAAGADTRARTYDHPPHGMTALKIAAHNGYLLVVKQLVTQIKRLGGDVDETPQQDFSALIHAAAQGHVSVVQTLLKAGAVDRRIQYAEVGILTAVQAAYQNREYLRKYSANFLDLPRQAVEQANLNKIVELLITWRKDHPLADQEEYFINECGICREILPLVILSPCGHQRICRKCWEAWKSRGTCPVCMQPVNSADEYRLSDQRVFREISSQL